MITRNAVWQGKVPAAGLLVLGLTAFFSRTPRPHAQGQTNAQMKEVPVHSSTVVDGKELYQNDCATCHGAAGKGNGPAAQALKTPPANLTQLAKNNQGKFPELAVIQVLDNGSDLAAHGSKQMPIWGPIFRSMGPAGTGGQVGHLREANLTNYLKSIQEK